MKRKLRNSPKQRLLIACTFLCALSFVHQSCTKIDTRDALPSQTKDVTEKFFTLPAGTKPIVVRIAETLKKQNAGKEFIRAFAVNEGYAIWDKAQIQIRPPAATLQKDASNSLEDDGADTVVVIPLVIENTDLVNGYLQAIVNDSISILEYRRSGYDQYPFGKADDAQYTAEKYQLEMMMLDKEVFGHTDFQVLDKRLFAVPSDSMAASLDATPGKTKTVTLRSAFAELFVCIDLGWYDINLNPYYGDIEHPPFVIYNLHICVPMPPSVPTQGTGGSGQGGGINPGGGSTHTGGGGGLGTVPITPSAPPRPLDPCLVANVAAEKMDSLFIKGKTDSVFNANSNLFTDTIEKSFMIYRKFAVSPYNVHDTISNLYYPTSVQPGGPNGGNLHPSPPPRTLYVGNTHVHTKTGYSAQSAEDIYSLIEDHLQWPSFEGNLLASPYGVRYAVTVTDPVQAAAFFNTRAQYLESDHWKPDSEIGKAFETARSYFLDKFQNDSNGRNLAYEMAMAAVLNQYNTGVTLSKKDAAGNFKPIVIKTTVPDPNEPDKKVYTQECL